MNFNDPQGLADVAIQINDQSFVIQAGPKGIIAAAGVTERGNPADPENGLVGSWLEYTRQFGGYRGDSIFPLLCKRALDGGAKLRISRMVHYSDVTNNTTSTGVKATQTASQTVSGPATYTAILTAANEGDWANAGKLSVIISAAASGIVGNVDIQVSLAGYDSLTQNVTDVVQVIGTADKTSLNNQLNLVQIGTVTGRLPIGTFNAFASGASPASAVISTDYIGDPTAGTGLHSFDDSNDFTKLMVPEMALPAIDDAIAAYQVLRGDFIGLLRTPIGLEGADVLAYRKRTGTYAGTAINNAFMFMFTGGLKIQDPTASAVSIIEIPELGDVAGVISSKDQNGYEWQSFAGAERGVINNVNGVVVDFGSTARASAASQIDSAGVNIVIKNEFGVCVWGNGTLQLSGNSLLAKAEVAELIMYIKRQIRPIVRSKLFAYNDPSTWQSIFTRVKKLMDPVKTNEGVVKWLYQGDQDIIDVNDATINLAATRDQGIYIFYLYIAPTVAMKYVLVTITVTNSDVDFTVATGAGSGAAA